MKTDNLVLSGLPENFSKKKKNILINPFWCKNSLDEKFKFNNFKNDHWYNRSKKKKDLKYLLDIQEKLVKYLSTKLNLIHKKNHSEKYWRILIGPYLYWVIPTLFDRWENVRLFFGKNKKKYSLISFTDISLKKKFTTGDAVDQFINDTQWNHKVLTKIILENYSHRISNVENSMKKNTEDKKLQKFPKIGDKKNYSIISKIFFSEPFFKILIFLNKYLFDRKIFTLKKFLILNLKLKNIPISTGRFFYHFNSDLIGLIKNTNLKTKDKNFLRIQLIEKKKNFSENNFENFLLEFILSHLPIIFVEKYDFASSKVKKLLTFKERTIFSQYDIQFNEFYKIWVAEMMKSGSKLINSEHGAYDPSIIPTNLFHECKISDKAFISHGFRKKKNQVKVSPTLPLIYKDIKINKKRKNIIFIHRELPKYTIKIASCISITCILEFMYLKKLISKLSKNIKINMKYKCINDFGLNLISNFSRKYGAKTIISKNQKYEDTIKSAKMIVCLYLSTPIVEAIKSNIPTLILLPKDTVAYDKKFLNCYAKLKKNKILFDNPDQMSNHINKIWKNIDHWWLSKNVQKSKNLILDNFLYINKKNNVENEYYNKLQLV